MWKDEGDTDEFSHIFGRTRLITERIVSTEPFCPEKSTEKIFYIYSKLQNKVLFSVSISYYGDSVDLTINPINEGKVMSSTCKITIGDPKTGRDEYKTIEKNCTPRIPEFLSNYLTSCYPGRKETDCPSICKELWNLYLEKSLCDVELKTEKKSLFVHKFVLCARSPVFLAMLTSEMKENITKYIEIEDISVESLEKFLIFLYTDAFEDIEWDTVFELYYAADKYQVERLKLLCSSYLVENVDCDSVCELLTLADRHHDCTLKRKVDDFIWKNESEVFKSTSWKKYASEDKVMALSTMLSKYEDKESHSSAKTFEEILSNHPDVLHDFESLYKSQSTSDIVIKTPSSSFPAHKTVLFASSSTFKDMFTRTCLKSKSADFFEIEDLEDCIVSRMLLFLYTDSLEDIEWDIAVKLYHAADMFQIQRLKFGCSCFLLKNLRVSSVVDLLMLSHEKRDVKLKAAVEDYISLYDEEVFGSDEWSAFCKKNSSLALETMLSKYKRI
ncbi:Speckle-type POZ protein like [Argiope bruennichi]|uniref:Speckle-type POZ protein like n=1 Tax=Argiope bruennichi TaxID=94029 RepID=A0A8T0ETR1_ARGBR|nr:Speckle-type POZ protein like [Argiope bruennichi]